MRRSAKAQDWLVLVVLSIVGIGLGQWQNVGLRNGKFDPITAFVNTLVWPISYVAGHASGSLSDFGYGLLQARSLQEENRRLKMLEVSASLYTERVQQLTREIESLRSIAKMPPSAGRERLMADVIGFAPRENRLTLSVGSNQGVKAGMPVVTAAGLAGTIQTVDANRSQALLVSSRGLKIGAMVLNRNPSTIGLIQGENSSTMSMSFAEPKAPVGIGDTIVTSGFSELIPRGIFLGKVIQVRDNEEFGERRALVSPFVSPGELREVYILK